MIDTRLWRFDDVSVNTDMDNLFDLIQVIQRYRPKTTVLLSISPIVFSSEQFKRFRPNQKGRVHPNELTAMSDFREYYKGNQCGLPLIPDVSAFGWDIQFAGHGIVHVDHRLLGRKSQEMSIVVSCALAKAKIFVPPYNKYNTITQIICIDHNIALIRFEDGWRHTLYNKYEAEHPLWYCHPYDMTVTQLEEWFNAGLRPDESKNSQADNKSQILS